MKFYFKQNTPSNGYRLGIDVRFKARYAEVYFVVVSAFVYYHHIDIVLLCDLSA